MGNDRIIAQKALNNIINHHPTASSTLVFLTLPLKFVNDRFDHLTEDTLRWEIVM